MTRAPTPLLSSVLPIAAAIVTMLWIAGPVSAQQSPRARDLGVSIEGTPGTWNAITDVEGVEVGHVTLIAGEGKLVVGEGPVRTGVTAILPRGKEDMTPVFAGHFSLNGNGEMTGTVWLDETGELLGPVTITSTSTVGVVRDAVYSWIAERMPELPFSLPVTAETLDFPLNDVNGQHVTREHALAALAEASSGPVAEGNVGGGTGMICHWFKGGIGTASRVIPQNRGGWTVGALVQCNYGSRSRLRIDGVPVGKEIPDFTPCRGMPADSISPLLRGVPACPEQVGQALGADSPESLIQLEARFAGTPLDPSTGSIIVVIATDAPLLPSQLQRVAKRVSLAVGRMGGLGENSSGDIFLAFSTARAETDDAGVWNLEAVSSDWLNPIFEATVQAVEEAIVNALVAAETMTGADGFRVYELPEDRLREVMEAYGRLSESGGGS